MKNLILLLTFLGCTQAFANEMPMAEDAATLDLLETLFEEGEMVQLKDPLTGEMTGFTFTHESIKPADQLSFNTEEME